MTVPLQIVFLEVQGRGTCHGAGCQESPPVAGTLQHTENASLSSIQISLTHETIHTHTKGINYNK